MSKSGYSFLGFLKLVSPPKQLLILVFLAFAGLSVASLISLGLGSLIWGFNSTQIQAASINPSTSQELSFLKLSQVITSIGVFIIPSLILKEISGFSFLKELKVNFSSYLLLILISSLVMILQNPLINLLAQWNASLNLPEWLFGVQQWMETSEAQAEILTEKFLKMNNVSDLLITLFIIAVIPALGEELLFRGTIQPIIQQIYKNQHIAIWLTAFIFSFIHFQFFGFLPRFLLGAFLGYLYIWGKSLVFPIVAHFSNNGLAVLLSYAKQNSILPTLLQESEEVSSNAFLAIFSLLILIVSSIYFRRISMRISKL